MRIFIVSNPSPPLQRSGSRCTPPWIDGTNEKWSSGRLFNELILHFAGWNRRSSPFGFHRASSLRLNNSGENAATIARRKQKGSERTRDGKACKFSPDRDRFRGYFETIDRGRSILVWIFRRERRLTTSARNPFGNSRWGVCRSKARRTCFLGHPLQSLGVQFSSPLGTDYLSCRGFKWRMLCY